MKKIILSVIIALGVVFSDIIYFEYTCLTNERWPRFLGFPFVQSTDTTWVFSMSGTLFLFGLLCNILFWSLIVLTVVKLINSLRLTKLKTVKKVFNMLLITVSLFITTIYFLAIDWRLKWDHDNFKMNYYQTDLNCERVFHFFE
jgi:hypothetical protein